MKSFLEWLVFEDDRLFKDNRWIFASGIGMATSFGAYVLFCVIGAHLYVGANELFSFIGGPGAAMGLTAMALLFFYPRYLPYGLFLMTVYVLSRAGGLMH